MAKQNLSTPQGADWVLNLAVKNADGSAKDLTNAHLFMTLKTDKSLLDTDPTAILITPSLDLTPTDGLAVATVPALTTIDLSGTYYYDIKLIDSHDVAIYLANGVVTFTSVVTRRGS